MRMAPDWLLTKWPIHLDYYIQDLQLEKKTDKDLTVLLMDGKIDFFC